MPYSAPLSGKKNNCDNSTNVYLLLWQTSTFFRFVPHCLRSVTEISDFSRMTIIVQMWRHRDKKKKKWKNQRFGILVHIEFIMVWLWRKLSAYWNSLESVPGTNQYWAISVKQSCSRKQRLVPDRVILRLLVQRVNHSTTPPHIRYFELLGDTDINVTSLVKVKIELQERSVTAYVVCW